MLLLLLRRVFVKTSWTEWTKQKSGQKKEGKKRSNDTVGNSISSVSAWPSAAERKAPHILVFDPNSDRMLTKAVFFLSPHGHKIFDNLLQPSNCDSSVKRSIFTLDCTNVHQHRRRGEKATTKTTTSPHRVEWIELKIELCCLQLLVLCFSFLLHSKCFRCERMNRKTTNCNGKLIRFANWLLLNVKLDLLEPLI